MIIYLVVQVRECVIGKVFGSNFFVSGKIKHLFEFLAIHKNISIQEGITPHFASEPAFKK